MPEVPAFIYDALRFQYPRVDKLRQVKDSEWETALRLPPPVLAWLSHFSGDALSPHFQQRKDGLWLHLTLLASGKDRSFVLLRACLVFQVVFGHLGQFFPSKLQRTDLQRRAVPQKC